MTDKKCRWLHRWNDIFNPGGWFHSKAEWDWAVDNNAYAARICRRCGECQIKSSDYTEIYPSDKWYVTTIDTIMDLAQKFDTYRRSVKEKERQEALDNQKNRQEALARMSGFVGNKTSEREKP